MTDLDQSGHGYHRVRTYLGPSLGWIDEQVQPAREINAGGTYKVEAGDSLILVNAVAPVTILLPDVVTWVQQPTGQPATGFDRSITVKDIGGNANTFNITIVPFGQQTVDNIAQVVVVSEARGNIKFVPLIDMSGWALGLASVSGGGGGGGGGGDVFKAGNNTFTGINSFNNTILAVTMGAGDNSTNVATTAFVKDQNYLTSISLAPYAPLLDPIFQGDPRAPTPTAGDNDTSIATTAFVQTALAGFTGGAPLGAEYICGGSNPTLTNERVLTDSASITWDRSQPGIVKANTVAGGGNVSNSGTPAVGQLAEWQSATVIKGIDKSSLGFAPIASPVLTGNPQSVTPASNDNSTSIATTAFVQTNLATKQPLDADLSALAALTGTNTIYYRSGPDAWSPVGFSGLTFSGGVLTASAGAPSDAEYITSSANATLTGERVITDTATLTWDKSTPGLLKGNVSLPTVSASGFSAAKTSSQTIPNSTWTKLEFSTALYNNNNFYSTANSRYAPSAGELILAAAAQADGLLPGSNLYLAIYKSGALFKFATANNTNGHVEVTCFDNTDGTSYYEVWIFGYTSGGSFTVAAGNNDATRFQGSQPMGPPGPAGTLGVAGAPSNGQYAVFTSATQVMGVDLPSPFTTGDVKLTYKTTADPGWILINDGSIGDATSNATTRNNADTLNLFTLFWNSMSFLVVQDSTGATVSRGANASTDFNLHKRLVIPKMLGRGLAIAGAGAGLTNRALGQADGNETHTMTAGEMFKHKHTVNDPGHSHGVSDPGHLHSVGINMAVISGIELSATTAPGSGAGYSASNSNRSTTDAATSGIGVVAGVSGISLQDAGNSDPFDIMNPRSYLNVMVKL